MKRKKGEIESFIIIRTCVGCVLPMGAKLIGKGEYQILSKGQKIQEPYYDYEILETYFEDFIDQNYDQLVKYKLLEEDTPPEEDKNPVKKTTLRGYGLEYKRKEE